MFKYRKLGIICDHSYMNHITKQNIMDNLKSRFNSFSCSLAVVSANAAEMSVSGAMLLTYTTEDGTEVTLLVWK